MNAWRVSEECEKGVDEFLQFACQNGKHINETYYCPCISSYESNMLGFGGNMWSLVHVKSYTIWTWHGELLDILIMSRTTWVFKGMDNHLEDMISDVGQENFGKARIYDCLKSDLEQKLYWGYNNFTWLSATLRLFSLK